jgi:hypothetical protein
MIDKKVVIGIVVALIVIVLVYASSRSGFYDGAVFDYTMPTVYSHDCPDVYYENGMPIARKTRDLRILAAAEESLALRQAADMHEAKKRGAQFREMVAARDMKREAAIKIAAENEAASLRAMANIHDAAAKADMEMSGQASIIAQNAGNKFTKLSALKTLEMNKALEEQALANNAIASSCSNGSLSRNALQRMPGHMTRRTMLIN